MNLLCFIEFQVKQDATSKFLAKLMVSKQKVKDEESAEDSDDFEGASVSSGDAQNTPEQLLDGKEKLKPKEKVKRLSFLLLLISNVICRICTCSLYVIFI